MVCCAVHLLNFDVGVVVDDAGFGDAKRLTCLVQVDADVPQPGKSQRKNSNLKRSARSSQKGSWVYWALVSSSLLRRYAETKTLRSSRPTMCLIGADAEQDLLCGELAMPERLVGVPCQLVFVAVVHETADT